VTILTLQRIGLGQAVGIAEGGRGVAVLDEIVVALGLRRVAGQSAALLEAVEALLAAGDHLVHV
jgi:hypothetical protein